MLTYRQAIRQTGYPTDRLSDRQVLIQAGPQIDMLTHRYATYRKVYRQADLQTERLKYRQANRQTD